MLGAAGDREVVAVDDLTGATRTVYRTEALPPLSVKGKAEPVRAARIIGPSDEIRTGRNLGPLVGRPAEVAAIDEVLEKGSGVVELVGTAGIGKSRLMALAAQEAAAAGIPLVRAWSSPYASVTPFGVMADLLARLLDIDPANDPVHRGARLREVLAARVPDLLDDSEALAIPLGAEVPQSGALEGLEVGFQREMVHRAIAALLRALHPEGLALIIEDVHWIDDASGDALVYLSRRVVAGELPLLILATRRNEGLFDFEDLAVTSIELDVLGDDSVREIANRSAVRPLADHELDSVVHRAAGNPLFAVELATAIGSSQAGAVPDSVESVIAARLDRASPEARQVLRILSVWGEVFEAGEVAPLLAQLGSPGDLDALDLAGIVEQLEPSLWGFTHALHREVAYAGLPHKRRRDYHRAIGAYLEGRASNPMTIAGILSVHYDRGGQHDRAWLYCREAGEQAERRLAQIEALDAYRRALGAGSHVDVPNADLADTAIKLGDAAEHAGEYEVARWAYRKARRLVPPEDRAHLVTFRKLGIIDEREGRYSQAQRWYRRGMKAALAASPRPDRGEWLLLTVAMGAAEFRRGRTRAAWDRLRPVAESSRAPADVRLRACYVLQLAGTHLNHPDAARYGDLGLDLVKIVRDPVLHGNLVNNLGIAQYFAGRWDAAAELYEQSYRLRDGAGDVLGAVMALNNLGEIRSDQRRFDEARRYFDDALRRGRAANTTLLIHVLEANRGRLATRIGDHDEADLLLTTALAGFTEIGSAAFVAETELRQAELLAARGEWAAAEAEATRLLRAANRRGAGAADTVPLLRVRAGAAAARGDRDGAVRLLRQALQTATEGGIRFQRASTLQELAALQPGAGHAEAARALLDTLGVAPGGSSPLS